MGVGDKLRSTPLGARAVMRGALRSVTAGGERAHDERALADSERR